MITLDQAEEVAAATLAHGRSVGAAPLTVAVLDAGGHLVVLKREDGSGILRPQIACAKAWSALGMGFSSRELGRRAERQPVFFTALASVAEGRFAPAAGGVLVRAADGQVLGGVGVSGDVSDVDEVCALAGVAAAGLLSDPVPPGDGLPDPTPTAGSRGR
ncbi:GlcG/HbpS family heme-binding protein [Geodermatophilus sp. URMC 60]